MYDNPKHIKKHPVKSRYDDFEREHLARAAEKAGEQVATFQPKRESDFNHKESNDE